MTVQKKTGSDKKWDIEVHLHTTYSTSNGNFRLETQSSLNKYWYFKDGFNWIHNAGICDSFNKNAIIYLIYGITISLMLNGYNDGSIMIISFARIADWICASSVWSAISKGQRKENESKSKRKLVVKKENSMHYDVSARRILEIKKICISLLRKRKESKWIAFMGFCGFFFLAHTKNPFRCAQFSPIVFTCSSSSFYIRNKHTKTRKSSESDEESLLYFSIVECITHRKPNTEIDKGNQTKI